MEKLLFVLFLFFALNSAEKSTSIVTLPPTPLLPGDKIGHFRLEWRLDSLGIEKLFARDHSYFGITPPTLSPLSTSSTSSSSSFDDNSLSSITNYDTLDSTSRLVSSDGSRDSSGGNLEKDITPLDEIHVNSEDSSIKNGDYYLNRKIFFGGHGEIWLAKKILENGNIDLNTSYVLKRMYLKDRPAILRCALREIYFGELLQSNRRIARFVTHFRLHDDYWLVFHDEGVSLQSLLYALTLDRGLPAFEPSAIWKRMRTTPRGEESMRSILYQIFLGIHSLHRQGIIHRDIKPSNILIKSQSPLSNSSSQTAIRLLIADFSSAVDEHVEALGLYGNLGPTTDEESEQYQPPETLFSCLDFEEDSECRSIPFDELYPESYDSWSLGVLFAEMILGTANIFNVDQRTSALISHRMRHASKQQQEEALKLAAMAEMCIYHLPTRNLDDRNPTESLTFLNTVTSLERALQVSKKYLSPTVSTSTCGILELERALQRRDPLGIGYHNKAGLDLLSRLLKWDPVDRISVREALSHAYFVGPYVSSIDGSEHMTQQEMDAYDAELLLRETLHMPDVLEYSISTGKDELEPERLENIPDTFSEQISSLLLVRDADAPDQRILSHDSSPVFSTDLIASMEFSCPKCGRKFIGSWKSCHQHMKSRNHGPHCHYDPSKLPPCLSSHSLLPIDPHSGWCDLQGRRKYIEDAHAVVFTDSYKFFGVFDGHFGNRAANYASHHIQLLFEELYSGNRALPLLENVSQLSYGNPINASQEWKHLYLPTSMDEMDFIIHQISNPNASVPLQGSRKIHDVISFLHYSFIQTNLDFLQTNPDSLSGTTATVSLLFDDYILIGNIGDSRAVLCCDHQGRAIQLTIDHTPYVLQERERILSSGGFINPAGFNNEILRVNNVLAVSRSIGDPKFRHVLSSEPDLLLFRRSTSIHYRHSPQINLTNPCQTLSSIYQTSPNSIPQLFLVLGSDGLWDVMDNQEVVDYICQSLLSSMESYYQSFQTYDLPVDSFHTVARDISREAFVRGSMDNIGVCVVDLTI